MGALLGASIGLLLSGFGFLVMRDPMHLALFAPGREGEGHFQRMVLDTSTRNQLRILGVLVCLFGASILTTCLAAMFKADFLSRLSTELWMLMAVVFVVAWCFGVVLGIWQFFQGKSFDWFRLWRTAQLGPLDVFPPITPKMQKEARIFTAAFILAIGVMTIAALLWKVV